MEGERIGDYVLQQEIGTGTFASVLSATHVRTHIKVAVKKISRSTVASGRDGLARFHREVQLIRDMDHPFIAEFYDVLEDRNFFYVVMELVENGNMLDYVNENGELQEDQARHYFCELISVLEYLHEQKHVAHRDLKAENVLLDRNYNIRLIDFGLSNLFSQDSPYLKTACGSPAYASPEMVKGEQYTTASDLWSAGILLYAITHGELPYEDDNTQRLLQKIIYTEPEYSPTISPQLKDLLQRMLEKDPRDRITLQGIKEHPWFSQYEYSQLMDMNFGLNCDWRVLNRNEDPKESIDRDIIAVMRQLGYDVSNLISDLFRGETNSLTAVYRMMRKEKITGLMEEISLNAKSPRRLRKGAMTLTKPVMRAVQLPILDRRPKVQFATPPRARDRTTSMKLGANGRETTAVKSGVHLLTKETSRVPTRGDPMLAARRNSCVSTIQRRRTQSMREGKTPTF